MCRIKPPRLPKSGTIGVAAPAGRVNREALHQGVLLLEQMGYRVCLGQSVEKAHRYFAGTDAERAEDFQALWQNPEIDAIVCARGGYGTDRMIAHLDHPLIEKTSKICVGSSDITSLLLYLTSHNRVVFHGPMVASHLGTKPDADMQRQFVEILSGQCPEMRFDGVSIIREGTAEGEIIGGCLTLVCMTLGTPYAIVPQDRILFLEDVNEAPYRIDRMLSYLKRLKIFDTVRGVIFGTMPGCEPEKLPEVILDVLGEFAFPMVWGFPSGHGAGTATLPFGVPVRLQTETRSILLMEPAVA